MANAIAYPSASSQIQTGSNPTTWSNLSNAYASDATYASNQCFGQSNRGVFTGFGFSLPSSVIIIGIKLETRISASGGGNGQDQSISLRLSGSKRGSDYAVPYFPETPETGYPDGEITDKVFGGPNDLWGTTWTKSQIEDSTFGVDLQYADFYAMSAILGLDYARLTVYYVDPSELNSSSSMLMAF